MKHRRRAYQVGRSPVQRRFSAPYRNRIGSTINTISVKNFRGFKNENTLSLRPITILFGPNSGGKSSLFNALSLLLQNVGNVALEPNGDLVKFGSTNRVMNNKQNPLELSVQMGESKPKITLVFDLSDLHSKESLQLNKITITSAKGNFISSLSPVSFGENIQHTIPQLLDKVVENKISIDQFIPTLNWQQTLGQRMPSKDGAFPSFSKKIHSQTRSIKAHFGSLFKVDQITENPQFWNIQKKKWNESARDTELNHFQLLRQMIPFWKFKLKELKEDLAQSLKDDLLWEEQMKFDEFQTSAIETAHPDTHRTDLTEEQLKAIELAVNDNQDFSDACTELDYQRVQKEKTYDSVLLRVESRIDQVDKLLADNNEEAIRFAITSGLIVMNGHGVSDWWNFTACTREYLNWAEQDAETPYIKKSGVKEIKTGQDCVALSTLLIGIDSYEMNPVVSVVRSLQRLSRLCQQIKPMSADRTKIDHLVVSSSFVPGLSTGISGENTGLILSRDTHMIKTVNSFLKELDVGFILQSTPIGRQAAEDIGSDFDILKARFNGSEKLILFSDLGLGHRQLVSLLLDLSLKDAILHVEEPESHLHPALQADLAELFVKSWKTRKTISFIETHSVAFFHRLQKLVKMKELDPEDVSLNYVDCHEQSPNKQIINIPMSEFGEFLKNPPKGFFDRDLEELT